MTALLLTRAQVAALLSVSIATVHRMATKADYTHLQFPKPIVISRGRVGWIEADVVAWVNARKTTPEAV